MENESLITHKVDVRLRKYGNDHHPRLIMDEVGNRYVAFALTHEKRKDIKRINYKLESNPNGEKRKSYVRRYAEIRRKNEYTSVIYTAKLSEKDYSKLRHYADEAIKKFNQKK